VTEPGRLNGESNVRDVGEFALIEYLANQLPKRTGQHGVSIGIGDDAAVWQPSPGNSVVVTTDALVRDIHFRLGWTDWSSLGHKAIAVNISDIAAMGATPRLATIVLGLTGDERVGDLGRMYEGIGDIAGAFGVAVAGGDVVRTPHDLMLSVTLIGEVDPDQVVRRSGARPGDLVVVSGTLGASAAGLRLLESPRTAATADLLVAAHLRPVPRVALGQVMHEAGVTAAMDLSDGLLGDLRKILDASGVSAGIDIDRVPVLPAVRALFPDEWTELALRGGEDYELLMTIPHDRFDGLRDRAKVVGATVTPVGSITPTDGGPTLSVTRDGRELNAGDSAFDHFAGHPS